jgi:hypothetical protein
MAKGADMEKLEGQRKKLYIHYVKEDLKNYARVADESARKTEQYTTALALEAEDLNRNAGRMDLSLDEITTEFETRKNEAGDKLLIKVDLCDSGAFLSLAVGCPRVPLSEDVMRQLKIYEAMKPSMMRMYDEVENIDGVFLFDTQSNILLFRTEYMFAEHFANLAGVDISTIYDWGLTFYDWFKFIDRKNNPERRALWSKIAFIAVEHDWITHLKAPMYKNRYLENEEMIGMASVHYNVDWLVTNTISKSAVKMMVVKDDSTLIGLNDSAKRDIPLETFNKNNWSSFNPFDPATTQQKKKFVYETLNLDHGKSEDVASFSVKLKSEFQFNHTLFGKNYTVLREKATELGLNFIALLEAV